MPKVKMIPQKLKAGTAQSSFAQPKQQPALYTKAPTQLITVRGYFQDMKLSIPYSTANLGRVPSLTSITEAQNYSQHFKILLLIKRDFRCCQGIGSTKNLQNLNSSLHDSSGRSVKW